MPRLPVMSGDDFVRMIAGIGYVWERTEGSHLIPMGPSGQRLSVPRHRALGCGPLRSLIRDAGLTRREFMELISSTLYKS